MVAEITEQTDHVEGREVADGAAALILVQANQAPFEAQKSRTSIRVVSGAIPVAPATASGG